MLIFHENTNKVTKKAKAFCSSGFFRVILLYIN